MDSLIETLKNLGPGRLAMMMVTFFALIIFFIFIAIRSSAPSLTMLYAGLDNSDLTEIAAKLDNTNIAYRISEDGKQISVPARDVARTRLLLAAEGLPRQGSVGYEIFDQKQGFGVTSFQQNINQVRALEGELARTIGAISEVKSARVHLVLPQRELFSRETRPASASVFLNLRNSAAIGAEQIQSIQHLVAAAVPQLKAANIAIIDQNGNMLARGEDGDSVEASARTSDEMRQKYEMRMTRSIEDIIGRIVGYGRVRATVTADLDFDVISKNSESFNPEGQVIRSTQTTTENSSDNSGADNSGTVSVANNLPGLGANSNAGASAGGSKNSRTEEVTNFEISKTIESLVRSRGQVKKLSVAVLVDGKYETDTSVKKPADATEDWVAPRKYTPRTQEELDKIQSLVKSSIGYDEERGDKIEVVNMPFAESDSFTVPVNPDLLFGFPKSDLMRVAETLSLSLVAVLIILLILRPLVSMFTAAATRQAGDATAEQALITAGAPQGQLGGPDNAAMLSGPGQSGAVGELDSMLDMSAVDGRVKASSVQKISELVTNHPNETVSVLRQWMTTEN
jgi:flagellar M-ring protein FliF